MKEMKTMKKLVAILLAAVMVMALAGTALAETPETTDPPTSTLPKADISITNMVVGDEVSLYKIIKWDTAAADWAFDGITVEGYDTVQALVTALQGENASAAMTALASAVASKATENTDTLEGTTYTYNAEVGSYLALVKGAEGFVYNPMVLSVNFTNPSTGEASTLDADSAVTGTTTVAKKQPITVLKEVSTDDKKNDVAVGDTIDFKVTTVTPNYGANYTDPVFTITDALSDGLTMTAEQQNAIVVKNGETTLTKGDDKDYTITASANGYTINFTSTYLHNVKANTSVTVEYSADVNEKAAMHNVEQYDNDVNIVFSNSPSTTDDSLHDETHHYTFSIDASLLGSQGGDNVTKELVKIGVDELTGEVITSWETSEATSWSDKSPLEGAHFTLVGGPANKTYEADSDINGYLNFSGLDAGNYTLTETSAPAGYKFSRDGIPVVISANYNADGTLNTYTITINGNGSTYTATNEGEWTTSTTINDDAVTTGIQNEKGVTLPSTGGIGTTIFYVAGIVLVLGAAAILVARRKVEAE
jgi:fimbrial isopeptide formation D2 family protein/LPXTG-motif cell wall-anchored protein